MDSQQTITPVKLFDVAAEDIRTRLSGLSWLTNAFGRAETVYQGRKRRRERTLAVYQGGNEYTALYPRQDIGNYSYLVLDSDVRVSSLTATGIVHASADASLVVFYDFRDVGTVDNLTAQNVAAEVLDRIATGLTDCQIQVQSYTDDINEVFRPMDLTEIEPALLMRPFGALRFRLRVTWRTKC